MLVQADVLKLFALLVSPSSFGGTFEARLTPALYLCPSRFLVRNWGA
jgi:hypothetical protein